MSAAATPKTEPKGIFADLQEKGMALVNGPLLNFGEAAIETAMVPPSAHRLSCGIGLTAGMTIGNYIATALTGKAINGAAVKRDSILYPLRGLYDKKLMNYESYGLSDKDEWMKVAHYLIPAITGVIGVIAASSIFFRKRHASLDNPKYLDQFDQKASSLQAKSWRVWAGLSSLPSSTSGFTLLPFPLNYGITLATCFTFDTDRAVLFPGLSKWWSNNDSMLPMQPVALLKRMCAYGAYNPARASELKQLDEMVPGVLNHWFNNVTQEQIEQFTDEFVKLRRAATRSGKKPKEVHDLLLRQFSGPGLEEMLEKIGLDPKDAILGNNGMSGKIASWLGAGGDLQNLQSHWEATYVKRRKERDNAPRQTHPLLESPPMPDLLSKYYKKTTPGLFTERDGIRPKIGTPALTRPTAFGERLKVDETAAATMQERSV